MAMVEVRAGAEATEGTAASLRSVTKTYRTATTERPVLTDVSLEVRAGRSLAVMGRSGSGKSTLLHVMGGMVRPTSGEVHVGGRRIDSLDDNDQAKARRDLVGFVFQAFHLIDILSVAENVAMPGSIAGLDAGESRWRARELLDAVGLDDMRHRPPAELSGGEQQRAAIARALLLRPALLCADEPTGNLDTASSEMVMDLLARLQREMGLTVVVATHDPRVAATADEVVLLRDGTVAERVVPTGTASRRQAAILRLLGDS
jgi:putative ABC transport system ATP-binding protein